MGSTPTNTEEDDYMNESFDDDEIVSDVEEEAEAEELDDSESPSDTDAETEFLFGNVSSTVATQKSELTIKHFSLDQVIEPTSLQLPPSHPQPHARRQQIFGKSPGSGNGFAHKNLMKYESSSSEDESRVVFTKTFAEVNQSNVIDDETLSDRTIVPSSNEYLNEIEQIDEIDAAVEDTEVDEENDDVEYVEEEDEMMALEEDEVEVEGEDEDDDEEVVYDTEEMLSEKSEEEQTKMQKPCLIDVEDCDSETDDYFREEEAENECSDDEMKFIPVQHVPRKAKSTQAFPNLQRTPVVPNDFEKIYGGIQPPFNLEISNLDKDVKLDDQNGQELGSMDPFNVKFLEQQMTQMSEMIMKTFRLSGGAPDNMAFEKLAEATNMMKKQDKKQPQLDGQESESILGFDTTSKLTSPRSEKVANRKCRCPSISDINEQDTQSEHKSESLMTEECGQGDGLRYSHSGRQLSDRIDCRVSSVTPTSFTSDNCGYHFDIRRPRSSASSEKFK